MAIFKVGVIIGLALWIGGLAFFARVVIPTIRKKGSDSSRILAPLFLASDRWSMVWSFVAAGALFWLFLGRHFLIRSLAIELPIVSAFLLTWHLGVVLHPQIHALQLRLKMPEFQGTAHLETIRFRFRRLHARSMQLHGVILFLGFLSLGLVPGFLK